MENKLEALQLWAIEYHKLQEIFADDTDINISIDDTTRVCRITCASEEKANVLRKIISTKQLAVEIVYTTDAAGPKVSNEEIELLFGKNLYFNRINDEGVILLTPEVVWVYTDDRFSPNGRSAMLPEALFKSVFSFNRPVKTDYI